MPHRDIIFYDSPKLQGGGAAQGAELTAAAIKAGVAVAWGPKGSGKPGPQPAALSRRGYLMPGHSEDANARNPSRSMRGPSDHQADSQTASHQAR